MKSGITIACCILIAGILQGCKKSNSSSQSGSTTGHFFKNTEWTGTCHTISQEYDRPCYLRFIEDTGIVVYSTFDLVISGTWTPTDSMRGKISAIDTLPDGRTSITASFSLTGEQETFVITDQNKLAGGTGLTSNNSFAPSLERCPTTMKSVKSSSWSSKKMTGGGPTDGMYAYPDLATFSFGDKSQEYIRNGHIITYTPTDHLQILLMAYQQVGPRVYLSGFNETNDLLIGYFGVLAPSGDTMWVDSRAKNAARLPNYLQTIYWYGPAGVTPVIFNQ